MNALVPIDSLSLDSVTGGGSRGGSQIDSLLGQLNSLTSSLGEIKNKTNGLGSSEMLLLCMLAMQNRQSNVVYVGRRSGCWW
jgi:hypothetical protein